MSQNDVTLFFKTTRHWWQDEWVLQLRLVDFSIQVGRRLKKCLANKGERVNLFFTSLFLESLKLIGWVSFGTGYQVVAGSAMFCSCITSSSSSWGKGLTTSHVMAWYSIKVKGYGPTEKSFTPMLWQSQMVPGLQFGFHLCSLGHTFLRHGKQVAISNVKGSCAPSARRHRRWHGFNTVAVTPNTLAKRQPQ